VSAAEPKGTAKKPSGPADRQEGSKKREGTLADFFANSPLRGANLDLERLKDQPRDINLRGDEVPPSTKS
jgi:hypothetical protein